VRRALGESVLLVAMTGYGQDGDRLLALSAGFDAHMTKPVDIALLEQMLFLVEGTESSEPAKIC
jgi:CheY-like chemotaxis protein